MVHMKIIRRKALKIILPVLLMIFLAGVGYINLLLPIITGYSAKYLCSAVFVSHRDAKETEGLELAFFPIRYVCNRIDTLNRSVTSRLLWGSSVAIYREGLGAVLVRGADTGKLRKFHFKETTENTAKNGFLFHETGTLYKEARGLPGTGFRLFHQKLYGGEPFAFLVVHHGQLIHEQYRHGFTHETRFPGWSIAKSITNAMAGIRVLEGKLLPDRPADLEEWRDDDRKSITTSHLLQMVSGLEWDENYGNRSDVTRMLYEESDFSRFALQRPLVDQPGAHWNYSSGSTNIVCLIVRKSFPSDAGYHAWIRAKLFQPVGMNSAVLETDATGIPAGSSYIFGTARDYARFGLLYLNDGEVSGKRIFPEGWVDYSTRPAPGSDGAYGAGFWINRNGFYPDLPRNMYSANGYNGQRIFILPSHQLVVVVLGHSPKPDHEMDFNLLMKDILGSISSGGKPMFSQH